MDLSIVIETDTSSSDKAEFMRIDGLSIDEVIQVTSAKINEKGKTIAEILKSKGVSIPVKLCKNTCMEFNLMQPKPFPEFELIPVNREQVLVSLEKRCVGLRVSDTYATNTLSRLIKAATPQDRFVSLVNFDNGIKRGDNVISAWLIMIEIDSMDVYDAAKDFGPELLPTIGKSHATIATKALQRVIKSEPIPPFLVCYSGRKSFHCFWQFDRPILKHQLDDYNKAKDFLYSELKRREPSELTELDSALLCIDKAPLFSATALGRIPCRFPEKDRFPQIAWRTGHSGVIDTEKLNDAINPIIEHINKLKSLADIQRHITSTSRPGYNTNTVSDNDLRIAFPDAKPRNGDGYSIRCPLHDDKTHSAFVSKNGYIYCSVCCDANKKYVAVVRAGGKIEKS